MKKEDLKEGDIFVSGVNYNFINKLGTIYSIEEHKSSLKVNFYKNNSNYIFSYKNLREATPEQKHWLEECIKENKFISYEKAMKTFKKEFVLPERWCVKAVTIENAKILFPYLNNNNNCYWEIDRDVHRNEYYACFYHLKYVKATRTPDSYTEITFEQFKKYVLKEKLEEPKDKVLNYCHKNNNLIKKVESAEGAIYQLGDKITIFGNSKNPIFKNKKYFTIQSFRWSVDKSKICAVFNAKFPNGIGLDKIELYIELKKELSLLEQAKLKYPVGTKFKIAHVPYIICTVANHDDYYFQTNDIVNLNIKENINGCTGASVYHKGKWAEIVEDFKLPETWWITIENEEQLKIVKKYFSQYIGNLNRLNCSNRNSIGLVKPYFSKDKSYLFNLCIKTKQKNPQITFEQFQQYVLHNGFKVGDRFNKQKTLLFKKIINVNEKEIIDLQYIGNISVAFYKDVEDNITNPNYRILTKNIVK